MEMVYFPNFLPEPVVLQHEVYKGHEYYVVNMGPHPCCYAEVPVEHEFYRNRKISGLSVPCHGGITYTGHLENLCLSTNRLFIGWDYAHAWDFTGYHMLTSITGHFIDEHHWTTEEMVQECKEVIDYLADMEQGCADVGAGTQHDLQNEKE